ncbi:hypothetical protein PR202_ga17124 [Eleusine coracana subsp. coracana]|uniref:MATH domain-containing protein n=1 Tax=Eleusine coracana subsp. coracana TaxID=191504 RepID=A0AAV5CPL6_ELECO|nr:hypothetical protein QOZ80_6AG0518060 [Eleusine coracana subsp. coracana]GJM99977.1 hypothetical protein PR202_ga17124 [Eleusine coracana subsp. coracana]
MNNATMASSLRRVLCSASAVVCKPVTGSHVLRIDGYSHLSKVVGNGQFVQSSVFDVDGHSWRLRLYPNGRSAEFEGRISAYLRILSEAAGERLLATARCSILDQLGNPRLVKETDHQWYRSKKGEGWGFHEFISREDLERSEYLNDDSFVVQCDVIVTTVRERRDHMVFMSRNTN